MRKKILVVLVTIMMLINVIPINDIIAAETYIGPFNLTVTPNKTTLSPGDEVTLTLSYSNLVDGITAYRSYISYASQTDFTFISNTGNNPPNSESDWGYSNHDSYPLANAFASLANCWPNSGHLTTMKFKLNPNFTGTSTSISFRVDEAASNNFELYSVGTHTVNFTVKQADTNANLSALSIDRGTMTPVFGQDTITYNVNLGSLTSNATVNISATKASAAATFKNGKGPRAVTISPGVSKSEDIVVVAESGASKTYTLNFKSTDGRSDDKELNSVTSTPSATWAKNGTTFSTTVPYNVASITPNLTDISANATITAGAGAWSLNPGSNTKTVTVKSQKGTTKNFTLNVTRERNTVTNLQDIKIDGTSIPGFNGDTTTYTYNVPFNKTSVTIVAVAPADGTQTILSGNPSDLKIGDNQIVIKSTAGNGTTKNYTINIVRAAGNNDSSLSAITIPGVTLTPNFAPGVNAYTATVKTDVESVTLNATPSNENAVIESGTGTHNLELGNNVIKVVVKAQDGSKSTYTITIFREKPQDPVSSNNNLKSLVAIGQTLSPSFDKDTTSYTITTDSDKVTILAVADDSKAKVTGAGILDIPYGKSTKIIKVTAENGSAKSYSITFNRPDNRSKDNNLKSLSVEDKKITPNFNASRTTYTLELDEKTSSIVVNAKANDSKAKVTGAGRYTIPYGVKVITVNVTAENEEVKSYTIKVTRASKNNNLSSIVTSAGIIEPEFKPDIQNYTLRVPYTISSVDFKGIAEVANSKVEVIGGKDLKVGDNEVIIKVTAQSGEFKEYNINVIRAENDPSVQSQSSENRISSIESKDGKLTPEFDEDVTSYEIKVGKDVDKIDLKIKTKDSKAKVTVVGNEDLVEGANRILITVTAENGQNKSYVITAIKGSTDQGRILFIVIVFIIILILLLLLLLLFLKKKKEDDLVEDYEDDEEIEEVKSKKMSREEALKNKIHKQVEEKLLIEEIYEEELNSQLEEKARKALEKELEEEEEEAVKEKVEELKKKVIEEEAKEEVIKDEIKEEIKKHHSHRRRGASK